MTSAVKASSAKAASDGGRRPRRRQAAQASFSWEAWAGRTSSTGGAGKLRVGSTGGGWCERQRTTVVVVHS
ncbi:hypothetical protein ACLOJK_022643 [Asimina triloba]